MMDVTGKNQASSRLETRRGYLTRVDRVQRDLYREKIWMREGTESQKYRGTTCPGQQCGNRVKIASGKTKLQSVRLELFVVFFDWAVV